MILRKLPLILAGTLTLLTISVNSEDSDTNDWIPIAQPSKPIKREEPQVTAKKAQGRVLNLAEPPEANFFPEETKLQRGNYQQQYLRETTNYQNPKRLPPIRQKQNPHPYRFDVLPQSQSIHQAQTLHQPQAQSIHQAQTLHQPQAQSIHQAQTLHQPQALHPPQTLHPQQTLSQAKQLHGNLRPQFAQQQFFPQPPPRGYHTIPEEEYLSQQVVLQQQGYLPDIPDLPPIRLNASVATIQALNNELLDKHKQVDITSTTPKFEKENVQLLYVPLESLNQNQRPDLPRLHAYQQAPIQEIHQAFARPTHTKIEDIQNDFIQQALEAHKLQQQFHENPKPYALPIIETTLPPTTTTTIRTTTTKRPTSKKRKPHQPPLAVYMGGDQNADIGDVLSILKDATSIDVQDSVGPDSPKIFVGPSTLDTPLGYAKFELPYLSSIENNRVERKVEQLPFFVAPLSYKTPSGYSKIPLPSPHVGSVVVNTHKTKEHEERQKQIRNQQKTEEDVERKQVYTQQNQLRGQNVYPTHNPQQVEYTQHKQIHSENEYDDTVLKQVHGIRIQAGDVYDQQIHNQFKPQSFQGEDIYAQTQYQNEETYTEQAHTRVQQQRQKPLYQIRNHEEEYTQKHTRNQPLRQQEKDGLRYQSSEREEEKHGQVITNQEKAENIQPSSEEHNEREVITKPPAKYANPFPDRHVINQFELDQINSFIPQYEVQQAPEKYAIDAFPQHYTSKPPKKESANQPSKPLTSQEQYAEEVRPEDKNTFDSVQQTRNTHLSSTKPPKDVDYEPTYARTRGSSTPGPVEEYGGQEHTRNTRRRTRPTTTTTTTTPPQQYLKETHYERPAVRQPVASDDYHRSRQQYEDLNTKYTIVSDSDDEEGFVRSSTPIPRQQYHDATVKSVPRQQYQDAPVKSVTRQQYQEAPVKSVQRQQYQEAPVKSVTRQQYHDAPVKSVTRQQYQDVPVKSSTPVPRQYQDGSIRSSTSFPSQQYQEGVRSTTQQYQDAVRSSTPRYQDVSSTVLPRQQYDHAIRSSTPIPDNHYVDIDAIKSFYSPRPTVLSQDSKLYELKPTQNTYTDFDSKEHSKKTYSAEVDVKDKEEDVRLPVYNPTERIVHQNQHLMNQHILDSNILGKTSNEDLVNRNRQQYYTHEEDNEDAYNLPQDSPQRQNHQIVPNLINNLEDQSVRQLLQPGIIPTSSRLTEGSDYAPTTAEAVTTTTTTTETPTSTYPSTHYPVVETTTKRTRGRQRGSRYSTTTPSSVYSTTRRTATRGRRPLPPRTRYQDEGSTTAYPGRSTTDPTKRIVTARSRFRTRGRQHETTTTEKYYEDVNVQQSTARVLEEVHSTTGRFQLVEGHDDYSSERNQAFQQEKIEQYQPALAQGYEEYDANVKVYHPSSTPKVEQYHPSSTAKMYQYGGSVTPKDEQYRLSSVEEYHSTPKVEQFHSAVTPKVVNVKVSRPISEPVVIQQINHLPTRSYEEATTAKPTRGRSRIRTRPTVGSTTRAPNRQTTTTTPKPNDEFYGFFREPNFKKSATEQPQRSIYSSTYVSSSFRPDIEYADDAYIPTSSLRYQTEVEENPSTPIQFLGEIRPKYSSSTPQYFEVAPTSVELRKPQTVEADLGDKVKIRGRIRAPARRVTTEESVTPQRGRTRGKSQYKPKPKHKDSSEDEDVEGGNYPPQFKTQPTPRPPSFQITIDPGFDDQEPYASIVRHTYVAKEAGGKDSSELPENYQTFNDIKKEKTSADDDTNKDEVSMYQQFLDELVRAKEDALETTTAGDDETTKARKRGVWKLVKRPVDVLEGAESQNIANIKVNSFDDDAKVKNKGFKDAIRIVENSNEMEDEVVTTESNLEPTSTTTEASLFGSLYEMFGLSANEAELNDEPLATTVLDTNDAEVTTLPAVAAEDITLQDDEKLTITQLNNEQFNLDEIEYTTFRPTDLIEDAQRINAMEETSNRHSYNDNQYSQEPPKDNNQYEDDTKHTNQHDEDSDKVYQNTQNINQHDEVSDKVYQDTQNINQHDEVSDKVYQNTQNINQHDEVSDKSYQDTQNINQQDEVSDKAYQNTQNATVDEQKNEDTVDQTTQPADEVSPLTTTPTSMTYITPMSLETWNLGILKTSTSTEISHETEICYKGRCIKSKDMKVPAT